MSWVDYYGKIDSENMRLWRNNHSTLDVSCIVLAGGKSARLGRNKVIETIGNKSLIERVISSLACFNSEIVIVTAKESSLPRLTDYPRLKMVQDVYPGKGTIGGIFTGLLNSESFYNLVVACDMPFLSLALMRYMITQSDGYDVVIPKAKNQVLEPLHAVYSKNCVPYLEYLIKQSRLSVLELLPMVRVKYIEESEIIEFDPAQTSFFNVNTEADLSAGRELVRKEDINRDQC